MLKGLGVVPLAKVMGNQVCGEDKVITLAHQAGATGNNVEADPLRLSVSLVTDQITPVTPAVYRWCSSAIAHESLFVVLGQFRRSIVCPSR